MNVQTEITAYSQWDLMNNKERFFVVFVFPILTGVLLSMIPVFVTKEAYYCNHPKKIFLCDVERVKK